MELKRLLASAALLGLVASPVLAASTAPKAAPTTKTAKPAKVHKAKAKHAKHAKVAKTKTDTAAKPSK